MAAMDGKGGHWTDEKLTCLEKYVQFFNTALKDKPWPDRPFRRVFVDAFAGSGNRKVVEESFFELTDIEKFVAGSAQIAIESNPPFDRIILIDKSDENVAALRILAEKNGNPNIETHLADANAKLVEICETWDKVRNRGVLFLDPFGCQVEWSTLEAVAKTECIDVWFLFPLSGVQRQLRNDGQIPDSWKTRLDLVFGSREWLDFFYEETESQDLFGRVDKILSKNADYERIDEFCRIRLDSIFGGGVSELPLRLGPRKSQPLYSLFFACSNPNPKASNLAHKVANSLLREG